MSKPWQPYALHILDAIGRIRAIQQRGDLVADQVLYDATLRNLQTLSEATQLLPDGLKPAAPQIPWSQISGFRNIFVHSYLGDIDPLAVAAVVAQHLSSLEDSIRKMLSEDKTRG